MLLTRHEVRAFHGPATPPRGAGHRAGRLHCGVHYSRRLSMSVLTLPNAGDLALSVRAKAMVFEDPLSRALLDRVRQIAPSDVTALIVGETGTGKEIVARHVHDLS